MLMKTGVEKIILSLKNKCCYIKIINSIFMKKVITILNQYLSHFWFTILALIIGCLSVVQFSYLAYSVDYFETNKPSYITDILGASLLYFFLPLGIISLIIALIA